MKTGSLQLATTILLTLVLNAAATTHYVDLNSPGPTPPYTDWPTAATNIQDAIDVAVDGDLISVTNGVYGQGGRVVFGAMTNRVAVTKPVTIQSVHGPEVTIIQGYQVPSTINGDSAVRGVYLTNGAWLVGFTVANGATRSTGDEAKEKSGGGVWCESNSGPYTNNAFITNCVLAFNSAFSRGGGGLSGQYRQCIIISNTASIGGGISGGGLGNCLVVGNQAFTSGGGVYVASGPVNSGNTVVGNSAAIGSGTFGGSMANSIVYFNSGGNYSGTSFSSSCTMPKTSPSSDNITNTPLFIDSAAFDFRLQSNSPCINAGHKNYFLGDVDLDGNPRIVGGTVDLGAYEFQSPSSLLSYAWAQQYGFPTDGSADFTDPDGDGMNNYGEWRSDTIPTNSLSVLQMVSATNSPTGVKVIWRSVNTRSYWLDRATNLGVAAPFQSVATDIFGTAGTKTYTDTTATNGGPYFYRVGVQ